VSTFKEPFDRALAAINQPGSPFELGETDYNGQRVPCFVNAPKTLPALLKPARNHSAATYIGYEGEHLSFSDFWDRVDRLATWLHRERGITSGSCVALAMRNYPEWMIGFTAIAVLGAVVAPMNSFAKASEIDQLLADIQPALAIVDHERMALFEHAGWNGPMVVARNNDGATLPEHANTIESCIEATVADAELIERLGAQRSGDDIALIMFTSGTSGKAKAAAVSHFNVCQTIVNLEAGSAIAYMTNKDGFDAHIQSGRYPKSLICVPLFHVSGIFAQALPSLRGGRGLQMMYRWDARVAAKMIEEEVITVVVAAPSMLQELMDCQEFADVDASSISNISGAGAATPTRLKDAVQKRMPNALGGSGWGMTETCGVGAAFTGYFVTEKPFASGFASPIIEFKFGEVENSNLPENSGGGEIWVRGPTVISRYLNNDEANRSDFVDGWFRTGDVGYFDDDGCLYLKSRTKDMIIRGGENVYPVEVEHCACELDAIFAAAGVGVPSEAYGEELALVVQCHPGRSSELTEEDVLSHCRQHLASYKVPVKVIFTEEPFPLNATNKVLKHLVREQYLKDYTR